MTRHHVAGLAGLFACVTLLGCSAGPAPRPAPAVTPGSPAPKVDPGLVPTPVASDPVAGGLVTGGPVTRAPVVGRPPGAAGPQPCGGCAGRTLLLRRPLVELVAPS